MKLSKEQIEQFREIGYVAVPHFFNGDEIRALQSDIRRLKKHGFLRNVRTESDGKSPASKEQNLQLCPASFCSALIRALPFSDKVIRAATDLIGREIALHLDQIFLKPGKFGKGTAWHQDNAYFKISDPLKGTAMWIAIDDAKVENGTMRVVPRAFSEIAEHERDPNSDHHIRCDIDEADAETVELEAGGVLFFCYGTPHATGDNRTERDRAGLAYHFINIDYAPADLFSSRRNRNHTRPHLTGPSSSQGFNEYGENMAQAWETLTSP